MDKDPFIGFISQIANKIKIEQDHKRIINDLNNKPVDTEKASLKNVILTIQEKISENSGIKEVSKPEVKIITEEQLATSPIVKVINEEENNFEDFVSRLKNILNKEPDEKEEIEKKPVLEEPVVDTSVENRVEPAKEIISNIKDEKEDIGTDNYLDVLDRLQDKIAVEKEDVKVTEIKRLIEEYAEKYVKRVVGIAGESGGGTNAVQYARGGTMDGDLNVTGNYLSGGVNLLDIFVTSETDSQTLSFNESNAQLSISNGNTVSLSALSGGGSGSVDRLVNGSYQVVLSSDGQLNVPGAIVTASNSKLDLVSFGPNTAYLTTTPDDSTALFMGAAVAELRASTYVSITTNTAGTPYLWEFGADGSLKFPDNSTQTTAFTGNPDSSNWDSTYTTVKDTSGYWSQAWKNGGVISNTAIGRNSLESNTTGASNAVVGEEALYSNQTGSDNVAIGAGALYSAQANNNNVAVGTNALRDTVSNQNVAVGSQALRNNTTGERNIAVGADALRGNLTGSSNIGIGAGALYNAQNSSRNIAIGFDSLQKTVADQNIAIGHQAMKENTGGANNFALGVDALNKNQTGSDNIAHGTSALYTNQTGNKNVAIGNDALNKNTASDNISIGHQSLKENTSGSNNIAIGVDALKNQNTPEGNIAIGKQAGDTIGGGGSNIIIGHEADVDNSGRQRCIVLGRSAVSPAIDGSLAIGGTGGNVMGNLNVATAGGTATGEYLNIYINGVQRKIALLLP